MSHASDGHSGSAHDCDKCDADYQDNVNSIDKGDGSGKKGCFPAAARILTPAGLIPLGEMKVGEAVLAYDQMARRLVARPVTRVLSHPPARLWLLATDDGYASVCATAGHPFLTARGWVKTRDLQHGDLIAKIGPVHRAVYATVVNIARTERVEPVLNIHTAWEHTFVVENFVVHNFGHFRALRVLWHRLAIDSRYESRRGHLALG